MCGIDGLYSSNSLEEKNELSERFIQALDEFDAVGDFRNLLESHFTYTWHKELEITGSGDIRHTEEALKCARGFEALPDKISAFVQSIASIHSGGWFQFGLRSEEVMQLIQRNYPSRFAFACEVAIRVFHESPYAFFQCFKDTLSNFGSFILFPSQLFYGESSHLFTALFSDKHLEVAGEGERRDVLWAIFERMIQWNCSLTENLKNLFAWETYASVPTRETLLFSEAFDYLCAWLKADAQSLDYSQSSDLLISTVNFLCDRESEITCFSAGSTDDECCERQGFEIWARKWFDQMRHQLSKIWCGTVNLKGLSDDDFEVWALRSYNCFLPLCHDLSEERATHLIAWGIQEDLKKWLNPKFQCDGLLDPLLRSGLWYVSTFRETWRNQLIDSINALSFAERLSVLGVRFGWDIKVPASQLPEYVCLPGEFYKEIEYGSCYEFRVESNDLEWWDSLLRLFPEDGSFPKELYPAWTLKALSRFGYSEEMAPSADKSLGIVRGNFVSGKNELLPEDIDRLIKVLEHFCPEKAIRHRLLQLRSSQQPYATENLDIDRSSLRPETMSEILKKMSAAYFKHESRRQLLYGDEWLKEELEFLFSIRAWIAQYCLSRLKLRKGEKTGEDCYKPDQVVEQSPIWRKAYLKVLEELGIDLDGKIHRAVNFTRKLDPVGDVRKVAQTCYKAVRRGHNKTEEAADIRRGLTAAYWWLLLAQRHALGLPVNEEEAVRTRRRLLRRP